MEYHHCCQQWSPQCVGATQNGPSAAAVHGCQLEEAGTGSTVSKWGRRRRPATVSWSLQLTMIARPSSAHRQCKNRKQARFGYSVLPLALALIPCNLRHCLLCPRVVTQSSCVPGQTLTGHATSFTGSNQKIVWTLAFLSSSMACTMVSLSGTLQKCVQTIWRLP